MVFNAMKLFMEVNSPLFDECSHEYTEQQNNAELREKARQRKWDLVAERAKARQSGRFTESSPSSPSIGGAIKNINELRSDDLDPLSHDSQRRLEALRLQDDAMASRERKPDRQPSVCNE